MSREIKFRAWVEGMNVYMNNQPEFNGDINEVFKKSGVEPSSKYGSKITYMQFTGLTDKNGVEIYEGDLVKLFNGSLAEIKYGEHQDEEILDLDGNYYLDRDGEIRKSFGFYVERKYGQCNSLDNMPYKWIEIIGNIFENPELLEVEK